MLARLLNALRIVDGIWLVDFEGEIRESWICKRTPLGMTAYVWPILKVAPLMLNTDGTTGGKTRWVKRWHPMRGELAALVDEARAKGEVV